MAFQSISFILLLLFHSFSTAFAQEAISFPGNAGDLEPDSYWVVSNFREGCCTLDMNVHRWDGDQWAMRTDGGYNDDDFSFHVPVYAPVDGEIASCWRQIPDNPKPGKKI
jgi:hypothetical protein